MSELIRNHRARFPDDPRSDPELVQALGQKFREKGVDPESVDSEFAKEFEEVEKLSRPGLGTEFTRGVSRGIDQLQSTAFGGLALAGDLTGLDSVRDFGVEGFERNKRQAAGKAPSIRSFKDVDDIGEGFRFITGLGGEVLPSAIEAGVGAAATGGIGFAAGKQIAKRAIRKRIGNNMRSRLAKEGGEKARDALASRSARKVARRAATGGLAASSFTQNAGETYSELYDTAASRGDRIRASLAAGTVAGALDAAVPITVLRRVFPASAGKEVADATLKKTAVKKMTDKIDEAFKGYKPLKRRFLTSLARDTSNEAWTEAGQEMVQEWAQSYADPDYEFRPDEFRERIINAAIAGAVGGAQFGGVSATTETVRQNRLNRDLENLSDEFNAQLFDNSFQDEDGNFDPGIAREKLNRQLGAQGNIDALPQDLAVLVDYASAPLAGGEGPVEALVEFRDPSGTEQSARVRGDSEETIASNVRKRGATDVRVTPVGNLNDLSTDVSVPDDGTSPEDIEITDEERETAESIIELTEQTFEDADEREDAIRTIVLEQRETESSERAADTRDSPDGDAVPEQQPEADRESFLAAMNEEIARINANEDYSPELREELIESVQANTIAELEERGLATEEDVADATEPTTREGTRQTFTLADQESNSLEIDADSEADAISLAQQQGFAAVSATPQQPSRRGPATTPEGNQQPQEQEDAPPGGETTPAPTTSVLEEQDVGDNTVLQVYPIQGTGQFGVRPFNRDAGEPAGEVTVFDNEENARAFARNEADRVASESETATPVTETVVGDTDALSASEDYRFFSRDSFAELYGENDELLDAGLATEFAAGRSKFGQSGEEKKTARNTRRAVALRDPDTGAVEIRGVYNNGKANSLDGVFLHAAPDERRGVRWSRASEGKEFLGLIELDGAPIPINDAKRRKLDALNERLREEENYQFTQADRELLKSVANNRGGFENIYYRMSGDAFEDMVAGREADPRETQAARIERGDAVEVRPGEAIENILSFSDDAQIEIDREGDIVSSDELEGFAEADFGPSEDGAASAVDTAPLYTNERVDADPGKIRSELAEQHGMPPAEIEAVLDELESLAPEEGGAVTLEDVENTMASALADDDIAPAFKGYLKESNPDIRALTHRRVRKLIGQLYERERQTVDSGRQESDRSTSSGEPRTGEDIRQAGGEPRRTQEQDPDAPGGVPGQETDGTPAVPQRDRGRPNSDPEGNRGGADTAPNTRFEWNRYDGGYAATVGELTLSADGGPREWELRVENARTGELFGAESFVGNQDGAIDRLESVVGELLEESQSGPPQKSAENAAPSGPESVESVEQPDTPVPDDKPPLRTVQGDRLPSAPDRLGDSYGLDPVGKQGVNLVLAAYGAGRPGFLLADGTGIGKTRQAVTALNELQRETGERVLYVTQNQALIDRARQEMDVLGISDSMVDFATYDQVGERKQAGKVFGAVVFDEAHNLKNAQTDKATGANNIIRGLRGRRPFTIFMTATPMDRPEAAAYFASTVTGETEETVLNRIGLARTEKTKRDGSTYTVVERLPGYTNSAIATELKALRNDLIAQGGMVRREYPFYGTREVIELEMDQAMRDEENTIVSWYENEAAKGGNEKRLRGQMLLELNRWIEAKKADEIYSRMKDDLAAGKAVVVMGETAGKQWIAGLEGKRKGKGDTSTYDGLLPLLARRLEADGIGFAKLYGGGKKGREAERFQSGEVKVVLATPQSGGTGIDLDDQTGGFPRSAYVATMNFSGDVFEQIMGRFSRRNTRSPTELNFVAFPEARSEEHRTETIRTKLETLATFQGKEFEQDPVSDIFAEEEANNLGSSTYRAPDAPRARVSEETHTITTFNRASRPVGRIDSESGIEYEIQRLAEASDINSPFKVESILTELGDRFGAGPESRVFVRRILESIDPEKLQTLDIRIVDDPADGPARYFPSSRILQLNRADPINDGDGVAMAFMHEMGHFVSDEILGRDFVMDEWQSLSDQQRRAAWDQYVNVNSGMTAAGDTDTATLFRSERAAAEWAAMQFHRIAAAGRANRSSVTERMKREGVKQSLIDRLVQWVDQLVDWFRSWMGDPNLSTERLDEAFANAIGVRADRRGDIRRDAGEQADFLLGRARENGFGTIGEFAAADPGAFAEAARDYRSRGSFGSPNRFPFDDSPGLTYSLIDGSQTRKRPFPPDSALARSLEKLDETLAIRDGGDHAPQRSERALKSWAVTRGLKLSPGSFEEFVGDKEEFFGSEHTVYPDPDSNRVIKITHPPEEGAFRSVGAERGPDRSQSAYDYLHSLASSNKLFGSDIRLEGILIGPEGLRIVTSQPFVQGRRADPGQIQEALEAEGFERTEAGDYTKEGFFLTDVNPSNVLASGNDLFFLDVQVSAPHDFALPEESFGSPNTLLRNKDIRKRLRQSGIEGREERATGIAPEVAGREEAGKRIVLENSWATHRELEFTAFRIFKELRDKGLYEGDFDQFYREFTDTPITPAEAKQFIRNFDVEFFELDRTDLDPDRRRIVDDYLVRELFETNRKLDERIRKDRASERSLENELDSLNELLSTYQTKFNDATALEKEALEQLRGMLDRFKSAIGAKGGAAKLGRLGEVIRQLEGQTELDNRIARKYLLGIERLISAKRFSLFDTLDRLSRIEVDFSRPANEIRQQMRDQGEDAFSELTDSEFASVIALAQADRQLLDTIVLRRLPEAREKLAIVESEVAETNGNFTRAKKAATNIKRYSNLKGRIAAERATLMAKIRRREKRLKEVQARVANSSRARDHFKSEFDKKLGDVGANAGTQIVEGVGLYVPADENATQQDIEGSMETFSYTDTTQEDITRILSAQRRWLTGPEAERAKTENPWFHANVLDQSYRLMERTFRESAGEAQSLFGKWSRFYFDSLANSFDKTNTRGGRAMSQMLQRIEGTGGRWKNEARTLGEKSDKARSRLAKALGLSGTPDLFIARFREMVDTPLKFYMENPGATVRGFVKNRLREQVSVTPEIERAVESYFEAEQNVSKFIRKITEQAMNQAGLGTVTNDRIKVPDPARGDELTPIEQTHRNLGTGTFLITPNTRRISEIVAGFPDVSPLSDIIRRIDDDADPAEIDEAIDEVFRDRANYDAIIGALARKTKVPAFIDNDGELVDRPDAVAAFEGAKPSEFFRALGDDNATVRDNLESARRLLADIIQVDRKRREQERNTKYSGDSHVAIDSRKADLWPEEWLSFRMGGATANQIIVHENAVAAAFGKSRERLDGEKQSMLDEVRANARARKANGEDAAKVDSETKDRENEITRLFDQLNETLDSQLGPLKDLRLGMEVMNTLVGGVLNGPRAAMVQLNQLYQPMLHFGLSRTTARIAGRQFKAVLQDMVGSLFEAVGITLSRENKAFNTQKRLFGVEPEKINGFWEFTGDRGNEGSLGRTQRGFRLLNHLLARRGISMARAEDALYTSFKPWAPFSQLIGALHKAPQIAFRGEFDRLAGAAIRHANRVRPKGGDLTGIKWDPKAMGYSQGEFDKLNGLLEFRVGVTLADLVARHRANKDSGTPFTDQEYALISSVGLDLIASESNVFTTRSPQMHTQMGRWTFPLLGWAIQQPHNAARMFKGAEGEVTRRTAAAGMMTLGFGLVPAVMAMAMYEDWFDEQIMGKKRNLRPLKGGGVTGTSLAVLERITRNGMLGMPMEFANLAVNGVGGGDLRTASLDQRVFLMNSIRGAVQLAGNVYAQKAITSNDIIRGMQLGGFNGFLQQTQMLSNLMDLDHPASRRTARINASNYLRVGGRMVGLKLNDFSGSFRPTPVTPHVTQMQHAALANDLDAFREAYRRAIRAAREHKDKTGPGEAEDHVARSWSSRHPLKSPFKTPPTRREYLKLLEAIGEEGARDVSTFVERYNEFSRRIGARPYEGKQGGGQGARLTSLSVSDITGLPQ